MLFINERLVVFRAMNFLITVSQTFAYVKKNEKYWKFDYQDISNCIKKVWNMVF